MTHVEQRNQEATLYVGDLDPKVDESILWELMLQAGPVSMLASCFHTLNNFHQFINIIVNVHIPRDKLTREHSFFGFVEFASEAVCDSI